MDLFNNSPSFLALCICFICLHYHPVGHRTNTDFLFSSPPSTARCAAQSFGGERASQLDPTILSIKFLNILLYITSHIDLLVIINLGAMTRPSVHLT